MLMASNMLYECGFHEAAQRLPSNQNQPKIHMKNTGMMTPQMVKDEILPVIEAPPKLRTVASQRVAIVSRPTITGPLAIFELSICMNESA